MNFSEALSLIASLAAFLYLFFRGIREKTVDSERPQILKSAFDSKPAMPKKKSKAPKNKPPITGLASSWMKKEPFPETPSEPLVHHKLGNPWVKDAYKEKKSKVVRDSLMLLRNKHRVREGIIITQILNRPRVTNPYTEWHIDR